MSKSTERPDIIREYLQRLQAREKSADLEEYTARLVHFAQVKTLLSQLISEGFLVEEGLNVLGDRHRLEERGELQVPDFVVYKEDVLFYVYLLLTEHKRIDAPMVRSLFDALRTNLNLSAVVLVWPLEDYASLVIESFAVRNYLERANAVDLSAEQTLPVVEAIQEFYSRQFVDWTLPEELKLASKEQRYRGLADSLRHNLAVHFQRETSRSLELPEKIEAQKLVSEQQISVILDRVLELVSSAAPTLKTIEEMTELVERLTED